MPKRSSIPVPIRAITRGPKHHWFGYYDKLQFDPTGRYVLAMEVDFEGRTPSVDDRIGLGMVDLEDDDRWIPLGETTAWCWQQGCMLQWLPGSSDEVIFNDRAGDGLCSHILNVKTGARRTLPSPVYALSPDGKAGLALDFFRTGWLRPGYGYAGEDAYRDDPAPAEQGIYRVDLATGVSERIITIADLVAIPCPNQGPGGKRHWFKNILVNIAGLVGICPAPKDNSGLYHWFNHILVSPDGERFTFLHRWDNPSGSVGRGTRMCTANLDGSDMRILHDGGMYSHFIWDGPGYLLAWANRPEAGSAFYRIDEQTGDATVVGRDLMQRDGHVSVLPGERWVLNDSYPRGQEIENRVQPLYLYDREEDHRIELELCHSPARYRREFRCDLHPRSSPDGRFVTIDSTHDGRGRQIYLLDIGEIINP